MEFSTLRINFKVFSKMSSAFSKTQSGLIFFKALQIDDFPAVEVPYTKIISPFGEFFCYSQIWRMRCTLRLQGKNKNCKKTAKFLKKPGFFEVQNIR